MDQGPPLDVLAAPGRASAGRLEGVRNVFPAVVEGHAPDGGATRLRLSDGPPLIVPFQSHPTGTRLTIEVRAEDILLARGRSRG